MLSRIPSSSFSTVRATVDQHSSHLPPRDGLCTGCPVTSRRSCLSSNFGLIGPERPVISPLQFLIMTAGKFKHLLLCTLLRTQGTTRGPGQCQQSNHNPWLALVFPLPRQRSLLSVVQWLFYIPHQCFFFLFFPDNLLLPVSTRLLVLEVLLHRYGIVLRRKGLILKND